MVALVALSGCLGGEDDPTSGTGASGCKTGDGVLEIHILDGAGMNEVGTWYEPANPDLTGIHTVCWVNDDTAPHVIIGYPATIDTTPQWVHDAMEMGGGGHEHHGGGGGHDHGGGGGHDHGGAAGPAPVINVTFGPGERLAMPIPEDWTGKLDVHCHPHPNMISTWTRIGNETKTFPVEIGTVTYSGMVTDHSMVVGDAANAKFGVPGPNVVKVSAKLEWDDSDDNLQGAGATGNQKDTFRIELKDPSGTVVKTATVGQSPAVIETTFNSTWPETAEGVSQEDAAAALAAARADDTGMTGDWTVVVTLVSAPGPVADPDGTTKDIQGHFDGKEDITVTFLAVNEFGKVLEAGMSPASGASPAAQAKITGTVS